MNGAFSLTFPGMTPVMILPSYIQLRHENFAVIINIIHTPRIGAKKALLEIEGTGSVQSFFQLRKFKARDTQIIYSQNNHW